MSKNCHWFNPVCVFSAPRGVQGAVSRDVLRAPLGTAGAAAPDGAGAVAVQLGAGAHREGAGRGAGHELPHPGPGDAPRRTAPERPHRLPG